MPPALPLHPTRPSEPGSEDEILHGVVTDRSTAMERSVRLLGRSLPVSHSTGASLLRLNRSGPPSRSVLAVLRPFSRPTTPLCKGANGRSGNGFQHDHRDPPGGVLLVLCERWDTPFLEVPEPVALRPFGDPAGDVDHLLPDLDGCVGDRHEVVIPVRMAWSPTPGGEDHEGIAARQKDEGILTDLPAPGPRRVQDQERHVLEV